MRNINQNMHIDVTAAVIVRDGLILLSLRRDDAHMGGLWEFPGGKREDGETLEACLQRELREELDILVETGECIDVIEHSYEDRNVKLFFITCKITGGSPQAIGCADFKWVRPADLAGYDFPEADEEFVKHLFAAFNSRTGIFGDSHKSNPSTDNR